MGAEKTGVMEVTEEADLKQEITPEGMSELSDDALDAAIAEEEFVEPEEKTTPEDGAETEETTEETKPAESKPDEETAPKTEETTEEESKGESEDESEETLKERLAKAERRLEDQDKYIRRRDNEVGDLRKMVRKTLDTPKGETEGEGDDEELITKAQAREMATTDRDRSDALSELDELDRGDADEANRVAVREAVPDLDDLVDTIAEVALKDGADQVYIDAFKKDPSSFKKEVVLVYANRAREQQERDDLKSRLDDLEGKKSTEKKGTADKLTKQINNATKGSKPKLTSASGGTSPDSKEISPSQVHELSDDALDAAIRDGQA